MPITMTIDNLSGEVEMESYAPYTVVYGTIDFVLMMEMRSYKSRPVDHQEN